jgi:autotransporter translocation and assembly factor TamB
VRAELTAAVSASGLSELGEHEAAALLAGPLEISMSAAAAEHGKRLTVRAALRSQAGEIALEAQGQDAGYTLRVRTARLVLSRLCTLEGLSEAAFDVSATATQGPGQEFAVSVAADDLRYGDLRLPPWQARLDVSPARLRLLSLAVPEWTRNRGKLDLSIELDRSGELRGEADLQLSSIALEAAQVGVGRLNAQAHVEGKLSHPELDLHLRAQRLNVGGSALDSLELSVRGGPRRYALVLAANAGHFRVNNQYAVELGDAVQTVRGTTEIAGLKHGPIVLTVPAARLTADSLVLEQVRAQRGATWLTVDGHYGLNGPSKLDVRIANLSIAEVMDELGSTLAVDARADAAFALQGTLQSPSLSTDLTLAGVRVQGVALGGISVGARLAADTGELDGSLHFRGEMDDAVHVRWSGVLDTRGPLRERLDRGAYVLSISARQDLAHLAPVLRALQVALEAHGKVQAVGRFAGDLQRPEGGLNLKARELAIGTMPPLDVELGVELADGRTWVAVRARDDAGTRASAVADLKLGVKELVGGVGWKRVLDTDSQLDLDVGVQILDRQPPSMAIDLPVAVMAQASFKTSKDAWPRADVSVRAIWKDDPRFTSRPDDLPPEVKLVASLQHAELRMDLSAGLAGKSVVRASVNGHAPVEEWLRTQRYEGDLSFVLDIADLDLATFPKQLPNVSGWVYGNVRADGLLSHAPTVQGNLRLTRLAFADSQPAELTADARADTQGTTASIKGRVGGRDALHVSAQLPWTWDGEKLEPRLSELRARARIADIPLGVLLGAVPQVAHPRGTITGQVVVDGTADGYDASGQLAVKQAAFTLKQPLIRFENLDASLRLSRSSLELEHLRWADQDGVLTGRGKVELERFAPTAAQASFEAKNVPVRRDTMVVAVVDAALDLHADLTGKRDQARVVLRDVAVRLPDQGAHHAQSLEPNPDVVYTESAAVEAMAEAEEEAAASKPLDVEVDASQPFWIRHSDFGLQLGAKLGLRAEDGATYLSGPVKIVRGFINLLGKGFDLQRGLVVFDGSEEVDPTLTIDAVHKLADGHTVTVMARGRASAPELTFTSTVPGVTGSAEALQLLVRGRDNSAAETAQAQMGAALAGLTAGFLSKLTRNKYGKYVPVLSLEAGASSGTRVRAGVEANQLIPPFLRSAVQGVYVEGFVGSQNQGGSRQGAGGVLVELYFPENIVTGGTWEIPNNWTIEATWEP